MGRVRTALRAIERFFVGHGFPALVAFVLLFFAAGIGALLLVPAAPGGPGAFAAQFRLWCFGADPATGATRGLLVGLTFAEFAALMGIVAWFWREPLRAELRRGVRGFVGPAAGAGLLAALGAAGFLSLALEEPPRVDPEAFQARGLRLAIPAPDFQLVDHEGHPVRLSELRGKVVLLTAVYATCGLACPRIMGQAKRAVGTLGERQKDGLAVLGVTLDPARDGVPELAKMAAAQGVRAPLYRLLTGDSAEVNRVLDRLDVSRRRNPETGLLDHSNVFILVDRQGRIAYRFSLGELQEKWLGEGLKLLLAEPTATTALRD